MYILKGGKKVYQASIALAHRAPEHHRHYEKSCSQPSEDVLYGTRQIIVQRHIGIEIRDGRDVGPGRPIQISFGS